MAKPPRKRFTPFTPKRQAKFLERLAAGWSVTDAARSAGIVPRTAYNYRTAGTPEYNAVFEAAWDDALEAGTDRLEDEAMRRAVEGTEKPVYQRGLLVGRVREYSDTLTVFLLKARRPGKYRERVDVQHSGTVQHQHTHDLTKLSDTELAQLEQLVATATVDARRN
jgi:hypothetical protein